MNPLEIHKHVSQTSGREVGDVSPLAAELIALARQAQDEELKIPDAATNFEVGLLSGERSRQEQEDKWSGVFEAAISGAEESIDEFDSLGTAPRMFKQLYELTGDYDYVARVITRIDAPSVSTDTLTRSYIEVAQYAGDLAIAKKGLELALTSFKELDASLDSARADLAGVFARCGDSETTKGIIDEINPDSGYKVIALQNAASVTGDKNLFAEAFTLATSPDCKWTNKHGLLADLAVASHDPHMLEQAFIAIHSAYEGAPSPFKVQSLLSIFNGLGHQEALEEALSMARSMPVDHSQTRPAASKIHAYSLLVESTLRADVLAESTNELLQYLSIVDWANHDSIYVVPYVVRIITAIAKSGDVAKALVTIGSLPERHQDECLANVAPYVAKFRSPQEAFALVDSFSAAEKRGIHYRTVAYIGIARIAKEGIDSL